MTDRPGLTRKQARVLDVVEDFIKQNGFGPSFREIAQIYGDGMRSLNTVHTMVRVLIRRGYLIADTNEEGRIARGSLALVRQPSSATVKVLIRPDGTLIRTETAGNVAVKVETVFPELGGVRG